MTWSVSITFYIKNILKVSFQDELVAYKLDKEHLKIMRLNADV